jgi:hypothetical protein
LHWRTAYAQEFTLAFALAQRQAQRFAALQQIYQKDNHSLFGNDP